MLQASHTGLRRNVGLSTVHRTPPYYINFTLKNKGGGMVLLARQFKGKRQKNNNYWRSRIIIFACHKKNYVCLNKTQYNTFFSSEQHNLLAHSWSEIIFFTVWLLNRLISDGLEPALIHTKKLCLVSYYRQFSTNIKIKNIKLVPVL